MGGDAVEQRAGEALAGEDGGPFLEGQVGGDDGGAVLVAPAEDVEQELAAGLGQGDVSELGDEVQPLFITVDPARDTVEALANFVPSFHPRLVGLTGSEEQIREAAQAYRVYYRLNEPDEEGNYLVDHTSYAYFMDPNGDYVTHFVFGQGPEKMAEIMRKHLN